MGREDIFNTVTLESMRHNRGSKWRRDGPDVIPLWLADPDFPEIPEVKEKLIAAIKEGYFTYSLDVDVQEAAAKKLKARNGISVPPGNIIMTQGVSPGMWLSVRYACRPGDDAIVSDPMYTPFYRAVEAADVNKVYWSAKEGEKAYTFDVETLDKAVTPKTKIILVCNPHNPTGHVFTEKELRAIGDVAIKRNLTVFIDELHEDVVLDGRKHVSMASLGQEIADRTISSFGFSKTYGTAGLQMGYCVATNQKVVDGLKKAAVGVLRGTNTPAKAAAPVMLDDTLKWWRDAVPVHIAKIRNIVEKRCAEIGGIKVPHIEGTYIMFPNFSSYGKTSKDLTDYLLKDGKVSLSNGADFGPHGEGHARMIIATSEEIINEAMNRMEKALRKLKK